MIKNRINNIALIDGQNLYRGLDWHLDLKKFRVFLEKRFGVKEAFYFLGFQEKEQELYQRLQKTGFIVIFNQKPIELKSEKKGNIDVCLTFNGMKKFYEEQFNKMILVSGDGDFKIMVDHFITKEKFLKVIFPNKQFASSLYFSLSNKYTYYLQEAKKHLEYKK